MKEVVLAIITLILVGIGSFWAGMHSERNKHIIEINQLTHDLNIANAKYDSKSVAPDTVYVDSVVYKTRIVKKPVIVNKTVIDTIYQKEYVFLTRSEREFKFDYINSKVIAWGEAPVDSFQNIVTVDFRQFFKDSLSTKINEQLKATGRRNLRKGVLYGAAATGVGVALAKIIIK